MQVLTGGVSSYSASPSKEVAGNLEVVGRETLLITAIQARNNARAAFAGSLSFFSNEYFDAKLSTTGKVGRQAGGRCGLGGSGSEGRSAAIYLAAGV